MQLLGSYNSKLASFQYQQLLAILQAAVASGDLSSGTSFDQKTLQQLQAQATSFANLPTATAGQRAQDESVLQPVGLLQARFAALAAEASNFELRSDALLKTLETETGFIERLLAADQLQTWVASLPTLPYGWSRSWDFTVDQGKINGDIAPIDPANAVSYAAPLRAGQVLSSTFVAQGSLPAADVTDVAVKQVRMTSLDGTVLDTLTADDLDWIDLTLEEDAAQVSFTGQPLVDVVLPLTGASASAVSVTGNVVGGIIPTYLRLLFYPRVQQTQSTLTNGTPFTLSQYTIDPDAFTVYSVDAEGTPVKFYNLGTDYTVDPDSGSITPVSIAANQQIVIRFTENFPAYQCSVDQKTWSRIFMLDLDAPFPDDADVFYPIQIKNGQFPLIDESGIGTGLYFNLQGPLLSECTLLVTTPGASSYGPTVVLRIDLDQMKYCNTISLSPFTPFAARLQTVHVQGMTNLDQTIVFEGDQPIDRATEIRFPRQLVSSIFLTFVQQSYTITDYQDLSLTNLRRSTMNAIEAALPFTLGQYIQPASLSRRVYEYALGFENIQALDITENNRSVFVQGAFSIAGAPEVVRFDLDATGDVRVYLYYTALDASGALVEEELEGVELTPGSVFVMPFTTPSQIARTEISLKFVQSAGSVLSRYNLQAVLR